MPSATPAAATPERLEPVDITPYSDGNTGVAYVTTFDSGAAGPHVMVSALVHGNELCGAHALAFLFEHRLRPRLGKLTLAFVNVAAYHSFDSDDVAASRYLDEDLNRLWGPERLNGRRQSRELARVLELRPIIDQVDHLLDLHSMSRPGPALALCGTTAKGLELAWAIGFPSYVVADAGHAAGTRLRDYGPFADADDPRTALLVECGQHCRSESAEVALEATLRFLRHFDLIEDEFAATYLSSAPLPRQRLVDVAEAVTIESERFAFVREFQSLEVIADAGTPIADDGGRVVRTPFDDCVLVMPSQSLKKGQTAVRLGRFVDERR